MYVNRGQAKVDAVGFIRTVMSVKMKRSFQYAWKANLNK